MPAFIPRNDNSEDDEQRQIDPTAMGESPDLVSKLLDSIYNPNKPVPSIAQEIAIDNVAPLKPNLPTDDIQLSANNEDHKFASTDFFTPTATPGIHSGDNSTQVLDFLFTNGQLTADIYNAARESISKDGISENEYFKQHPEIDEHDVVIAKSKIYNLEYIDLSKVSTDSEMLHKIPINIATKQGVILFEIRYAKDDFGKKIEVYCVAMVDPLDIQSVRFLESTLNKKLKVYISEESRIRTIIENKYNSDVLIKEDVNKAIEDAGDEYTVKIEEQLADVENFSAEVADAPVTRIVSMILEYGIKFKASDAHIEPRENKLSVRFRINGLLVEKLTDLPLQLVNPIVARIKILSNLKIDEHRVPQDGRFEVAFGKVKVDIRVSIMPTVYGEKVVLRFLDKTSGVFPLESTGLRGSAYKVYKDSLKQTQGIILVTGPTGSGKTVTLASSLAILNKPEVNIVTLEDPVEIRINGVNQVQVNNDVGLTFASGLRSFLRQDPDVIMVGEIRDEETAQLATQAALVGRLVIATLHTNSAAGAIPRLLNMNIEPFLLSSVINVIMAQRLPRKICEHCKESHNATEEQIKMLHTVLDGIKGYDLWNYGTPRDIPEDETKGGDILVKSRKEKSVDEKVKLFKGKGCEYCNDSGYLGRIGIFEVLKVDEKISKLIMQHKSAQEIQDFAVMEGMITMIQDGFMKALEGITTIEEVLRVQY